MAGGRYGIRVTTQVFITGRSEIGYLDRRFDSFEEAALEASGLSYGDSSEYHQFEAVDLIEEGRLAEEDISGEPRI